MTATTTTIRKTIAELFAEQADSLVPVDGDKAYTFYHGKVWAGVLKHHECGVWLIVPPNGQKLFDGGDRPYLPLGYKGMKDVASVDVYGPDYYTADREDSWHEEIKKMGFETPNRMVAYDVAKGMFYLRA